MAHTAHTTGGDWLTTGQVAEFLGLSRWTVRNLRQSGELPYQRYKEKVIRYARSDVEAYRDRSRVDLTEQAPANPLGRATRRKGRAA